MKQKHVFAVLAAVILMGGFAVARTIYRGPLAYESGLAYSQNYTLNVANNGITRLAATASYSSATVTTQTFQNGVASTGSFTVSSLTGLAGRQGTNFVTVLSTNGLSGSSILIGGTTLTESIQWWTQTSTNSVATSIKTAINNNATQFTATTTGNRVNISCVSSGTWCNQATLSVVGTSSVTAGAATFSGGTDNTLISVNNISVLQGSGSGKWAVGASSAATATNIAAAFNANTSMAAIISSTAPLVCGLSNPCGVVKLTSLSVGTSGNYALYTSSNAAITLSAPVTILSANGNASGAMTGGANSDTTAGSASINIAANPFWARATANGQASMTGFGVVYSTASGVGLSGLQWGTTYFVIPVDYNTIKLASSVTNARAGTAITIASSSTQTTANTFTLTPQAISGTPSGKWQVSNDGNLWSDYTTTSQGVAVSSFTVLSYTAGGASTSWDFGPFTYQYIRLAVVGPTTGGLNLLVTMNGTSSDH